MSPFIIIFANMGQWHRAFFGLVSIIAMNIIYYMRAIIEERHLSGDPAYVEYCKKVRYRFLPRII